jgi:flagellar motor protein MotB
MKSVHRAKLVILLSLVGLSVVGCWNKDKEQIRALYRDKQILIEKNEDLQTKLGQSEEKHAELQILLDGKEAQLAIAQAKITSLEAERVPPKPTNGGNGDTVTTTKKLTGDKTWTVGGDVLFASGQATLSAAGRRELNRVIDSINKDYSGSPIRVYGHTDSQKIVKSKWKDNLHLSGARAMEVRRYMVAKGIRAENIETIAMGASNPVASNSTSAGRSRNRRVEIKVIRK